MRLVGSFPGSQAVKATETVIDFIERGGTLMRGDAHHPVPTRPSCHARWSRCQP